MFSSKKIDESLLRLRVRLKVPSVTEMYALPHFTYIGSVRGNDK